MPKTATPSRNRLAKEDLTRSSAARFENIGRYRAAFARCRPSAWTDIGFRRLHDAELFQHCNPDYAQACLLEAAPLLAAAMAIGQRR